MVLVVLVVLVVVLDLPVLREALGGSHHCLTRLSERSCLQVAALAAVVVVRTQPRQSAVDSWALPLLWLCPLVLALRRTLHLVLAVVVGALHGR